MNRTLDELLQVHLPRNVGIAGWLSTTEITGPLIRSLDKIPVGDGPVYNFVLRLRPGGPRPKRFQVLKQLSPKKGLAKVEDVTPVLKYLRSLYEYEHVILTTWDHGSGFAFFADPDPLPIVNPVKTTGKKTAPPAKRPRTPKLSTLRARLQRRSWLEEYQPEGLTMISLRAAIFQSFGTIDVIFMRNCYMQLFDTGMLMRDVADYLVACESTMYFEAYDYTIWLKAMLKAGKKLTDEKVAATAILGFTKAKVVPEHRIDTAIFGLDLSFFAAINDAMNRMIRQLILGMKKHKHEFKDYRSEMIEVQAVDWPGADFQLVDAKHWFQLAKRSMKGNKKYQEAWRDFLDLHKRMVGDRAFIGSLLQESGYSESGFSIYFPGTPENLGSPGSFYSLYYVPMSKTVSPVIYDSLWPVFLGYLLLDIKPKAALLQQLKEE